MQPIELKEFVPRGAEFYLRKTDKTYRLNPVMALDEVWIQENIGEDLQIIFQKMRIRDICRIAFHQMTEEDKEDFLSKEVTLIDEDGNKTKQKMGGAQLLCAFISGPNEKAEVARALLQTIGISRPVLEKAEEEVKKKLAQEKLTGQKSLTSSQPSTDGPQNTFSPEQPVSSTTESPASESA